MGLHRYFLDQALLAGQVALSSDEAHHALRVRREAIGNRCVVFDGQGNESQATIVNVTKRDCELAIERVTFLPRDLPGHFTLGVSLPKGDRLHSMIEKAVELGVHALVPIITDRSVKILNDNSMEKLRRFVVEACKQCERNRLMQIRPPISFRDWLASVSSIEDSSASAFRIIAHPDLPDYRQTMQHFLKKCFFEKPSRGFAAVGPEGGFTDDEVLESIVKGWQLIDLGSRILRVETAVASVATIASIVLDDHQVILGPSENECDRG